MVYCSEVDFKFYLSSSVRDACYNNNRDINKTNSQMYLYTYGHNRDYTHLRRTLVTHWDEEIWIRKNLDMHISTIFNRNID